MNNNTDISDNFPGIFPTKVIISALYPESKCKRMINEVLTAYSLNGAQWKVKTSGAGKYFSFSFNLALETLEQMQTVYSAIQKIPEVKYIM